MQWWDTARYCSYNEANLEKNITCMIEILHPASTCSIEVENKMHISGSPLRSYHPLVSVIHAGTLIVFRIS